jgi:predicted ATPase
VATTLGRLLAANGRGDDARSAVASALAAIEGGSETADVREAHQLIDSLSTTALEA